MPDVVGGMASELPNPNTVVVGGGLAGLVAAATAARAGAQVTLLDTRSFGGRARSVHRDGFVLNDGGHALYRGGGGWAILESLGVRPLGTTPDVGSYRTVWDGEIAPLPVTARGLASTRLLGARSKLKLAKWFGDMGTTASAAGDVSLEEWLADQGARPDLRKYLLAMGRLVTYGARPEDLPARVVLNQFTLGGVAYLHGGWQTLVDGLVETCRDLGVDLLDHRSVTALDRDGDGWHVITSHGAVAGASVVLAAGGPQLAVRLLGADPAGWIERAGPVQRAACLDVGGQMGDVSFLQSADEPLYLSLHAPVADLAPDGEALYSVMRYLSADDDDGASTADAKKISLERHAELAGLPKHGDRSIERYLASMVVTWGSPQVGIERPSGLELADRGIFAAGDWIGRPLLADASIVSGAAAGAAAARRAMVAA